MRRLTSLAARQGNRCRSGCIGSARPDGIFFVAQPFHCAVGTDPAPEENGFEPSVPLLRKALLGVANRRRRHERRSHLQVSGPKRQCLPGVAANSLSLRGGTASSNPSSSRGESGELPYCNAGWLPVGDGLAASRRAGPAGRRTVSSASAPWKRWSKQSSAARAAASRPRPSRSTRPRNRPIAGGVRRPQISNSVRRH